MISNQYSMDMNHNHQLKTRVFVFILLILKKKIFKNVFEEEFQFEEDKN